MLLVDENERVLFLHAKEPSKGHRFWVMPGGGLGESYENAALRKTLGETGIAIDLGPCIWTRGHVLEWDGKVWEQHERFFVACVRTMDVQGHRPDTYMDVCRWWTPVELQDSTEDFVPRRIAEFLSARGLWCIAARTGSTYLARAALAAGSEVESYGCGLSCPHSFSRVWSSFSGFMLACFVTRQFVGRPVNLPVSFVDPSGIKCLHDFQWRHISCEIQSSYLRCLLLFMTSSVCDASAELDIGPSSASTARLNAATATSIWLSSGWRVVSA